MQAYDFDRQSDALCVLAAHFTVRRGVIMPQPDYENFSERECDAIDYLCDEHDYVYEDSDESSN